MKHHTVYFFIVLATSILMALLNSLNFFVALFRQPTGTVYLGTIHYFEDYFFYLNHFFQGAHGEWLTLNRYTSEITQPNIIYWTNVMLGKLGGMFFLTPILAYNISILLLSLATLVVSFLILLKLTRHSVKSATIAFLCGTLATSLINRVDASEGGKTWWPFQIWGTPHLAFDRLGGAPHHLLRSLLFYIYLWFLMSPAPDRFRKIWIPLAVVASIAFTTVNPIQSVTFTMLFVLCRLAFALAKKQKIPTSERLRLAILTLTVLGSFFVTSKALDLPPYSVAKIWESAQHSYTTPGFLALSLGPILILCIVGIVARIKRLNAVELTGILFLTGSYVAFLSPLPELIGVSNLRILFPSMYIFWGLFAAYGIEALAGSIGTNSRLKPRYATLILVLFFLLLSYPTLHWEIGQKIQAVSRQNDQMTYLASPVYDGFQHLSTRLPYSDIVLGNPASHMDTLIPALSGHTSYSGHIVATIDNGQKQGRALAFYRLEMGPDEATSWLAENSIRYSIFTRYDGNPETFAAHYPFLRLLSDSSNDEFWVYEVQPSP